MKCIKKILSSITALSLLLSMSLPVFAVSGVTEYKYDSDLPLGIATDFHMFIHSDASLNAHCFGNIAVGNLVSVNSTFGQALVKDNNGNEVRKNDMANYIKKLSTDFSVAFYGNPFVFGKDAKVVLTDNGHKNKVEMNGFSTTEMPFSDCTMYVENELNPFIDLDKEFENLKELSAKYADTANSGDVQTKFDMNSAEIKTSAEGVNVKNIKYKDTIALCNNAILNVVLNNINKSTIIINVDLAGAGDNVYVPVRTRFNGEGNKERSDSENSKVLWNFYDSSKADNVYNGTINFPNEWVGSIMAPGAKVNLYSNFDGTLIADSCSISGESHSWYYTGEMPEDIKPSKPVTTTISSEITTTTPKPTTTTSSEITTTTPKPTTTTSSEITTTTPKPTTTTSSEITTTTPKPTTTTSSEITTTTPKPTTTTSSEITTTTPKPTTTTSSEITTTTPKPTTTTASEITTTTPKPTTTTSSEITTTTPKLIPISSEITTTTVTSQNSITTPTTTSPIPLIVTNTTTKTPLVTIPENPTQEQIRRTLAYIDELLKKDDLTDEECKELKRLRRTLALMIENTMPNTGTEDRKATPVVLGGLFLSMGVYGFFNRRKLIGKSEEN